MVGRRRMRRWALVAGCAASVVLADGVAAADGVADEICTFHRGTTTCVSAVTQSATEQRVLTSGCLAGPERVPGVRRRVFEDVFAVTIETTTLSRGRRGHVHDVTTTEFSTLVSSRFVEDTCAPV